MSMIVLIRHVETDMAGRFCGHSDPAPNLAGETQIAAVVEKVKSMGISRIYSSDLRRAAQTATAIGQSADIEVRLRPGLREIHFGAWEGLSWKEVEVQFPQEAKLWLEEFPSRAVPGGERYSDFAARVGREFTPLLNETEGCCTAVITHRGVLQYVLTRYFNFQDTEAWERTAAYGTVISIARSKGEWIALT